ncbi:MAG: DUF262 domain-containing protein [Flavobacteriales bacterium]|nr:DUF262 domain-containing protein [Flavobacteriales bacterium]
MKNVEKADRIHLGSLIEDLKKGKFVIPDFQREFEWQPWDIQNLMKSIFMDYYVGTLLLWKGSRENFKMLNCTPIETFTGDLDPQHIVLDGQQRLTAMYYAFFQPDMPIAGRARPMAYFLNIQAFLDGDFEEAVWYDSMTRRTKSLLDDIERQYEEHVFPLGVMKEGTWGTSDWIKGYRDYWIKWSEEIPDDVEDKEATKREYLEYAEKSKLFKSAIEELFNQYYISYIELDRDIDIDKVCDIFTQINSRGVQLDIFDLLNAMLRPKEIQLKQMWHESEKELLYTDPKKMKIYVLQVMSILLQSYCSSKFLYYLVPEAKKTVKNSDGSKEQRILIETSEEFIEKWEDALIALKKAIQSLKSPRDFGAIQPNFVPYPSIIPAFAAIKRFVDSQAFTNKLDIQTKIRKWYWASIFTNRYSSSVESNTAKDFQALKRWFENDDEELEVIGEFISNYRNINLIDDNHKGSAVYNAIFNLFVINEARDWSTFDLPEYESLDDHHIVPYSRFHKVAGRNINSILNRTPLSPTTNRHIIRNRMPNEYIKEMLENNDPKKVYEVLSSHLISKKAVEILLRKPFTKEDFDEFLNERMETIRNAIDDQLIKEKIEIPIALQKLNEQIELIELTLRKLIADSFEDSFDKYKQLTPQHIQDNVDKRVVAEMKRKPDKTKDDYSSFSARLTFFDLREYYEFMVKPNWQTFESRFGSKQQLELRFQQLANLRNAIRHSRELSKFEKHDGEAAIAWFSESLKTVW